jgi:hypothetical protein
MAELVPPADLDNSEVRGVYLWRRDCFLADRFSWDQAVRLAKLGADHHEAEQLLAAGCPHDLAFKLLR